MIKTEPKLSKYYCLCVDLCVITSFTFFLDVVKTYYHSWGFLSMSLGRCHPLFQELLLLLQPLSVLPFDLNLLLEPRLLRHRQLWSEEQALSPPQPCSALLATSWPRLQGDKKEGISYYSQISHQIDLHRQESLSSHSSSCNKQQCGCMQTSRSPVLAPIPEWCPKEPDLVDGMEDCSQNHTDTWFQISMDNKKEETKVEKDCGISNPPTTEQAQSPCWGGLRWAKLFGATGTSSTLGAISQSHTGAHTTK